MNTVTIQTKNIDIEVRDKAEEIVRAAGLSSLQDVIRVMIIDIANGRLPIKLDWGRSNDPEIRSAIKEYKSGKFIKLNSTQKISDVLK